MLTWYEALVLGLVEGITEYLPISSTGHLILTAALLGLDEPAETKNAVDRFLIVIQGGAILAVLGLYWGRVGQMVRGLLGRDAAGRRLLVNLCIAFAPAAVTGVLLDELLNEYLFKPFPVLIALALGGVVMIGLGPWQRRVFHAHREDEADDAFTFVDIEHLTWRRALLIGCFQILALWPGTSRSMVTIVGGMVVGLRPKHAAEFSFLLGLPTLGGACVYRLMGEFTGDEASMFDALGWPMLLLGIAMATVSAALAIKWLVSYLGKHGVAVFGWYRLALCAAFVILLMMGLVSFPTG